MKSLIIILAVLGLAGPVVAEPTLAEKLAALDAGATGDGYVQYAGPYRGSLRQGETEKFWLPVIDGLEVGLAAVCDGDCGDLDLVIRNEDGGEVMSDRASNAEPKLLLAEEQDGIAVVEVVMANCSRAPCAFVLKAWYQ